MPPKRTTGPTASQQQPATYTSTGAPVASTTSRPATARPVASKSGSKDGLDAQAIVQGVWNKYVDKTPQRTKLLDTFMGFLVVVGVLQFVYVVVVGNFVCVTLLLRFILHRSISIGVPSCILSTGGTNGVGIASMASWDTHS